MKALFVTIPHSGEKLPQESQWLAQIPPSVLFRDVDRFVDILYLSALKNLQIPSIIAQWHRYAVDLNRWPSDIDSSSVENAPHPAGTFARGFHWVNTTHNEILMNRPMATSTHQKLIELIHNPFHASVQQAFQQFKQNGHRDVYHLDLHSMPSLGTSEHKDPGELRADVVISDIEGKSASKEFVNTILTAYLRAGFKVAYNWPYRGGRITETYGRPEFGQHTVQVELNRNLYMNEKTHELLSDKLPMIQKKLQLALFNIINES